MFLVQDKVTWGSDGSWSANYKVQTMKMCLIDTVGKLIQYTSISQYHSSVLLKNKTTTKMFETLQSHYFLHLAKSFTVKKKRKQNAQSWKCLRKCLTRKKCEKIPDWWCCLRHTKYLKISTAIGSKAKPNLPKLIWHQQITCS